MPKRIEPTAKQKRIFIIHAIIFVVCSAIMLLTYDKGSDEWVYPWPAWIVAAWSLALLGNWCAVYANYEDAGIDEYNYQSDH